MYNNNNNNNKLELNRRTTAR